MKNVIELFSQESYKEIEQLIGSDSSPVGIDAKKTHIIILQLLDQIDQRLGRLEERLDAIGQIPEQR